MLYRTGTDMPGRGRLAHAPADHPAFAPSKVGILLVNLGTPDGTDYWSMRRYLSEFLSDKRVIDYSPWLWQPILQLIVLSKRPFSSGAAYRGIWNEAENESPLLTITRSQTAKLRQRLEAKHGAKVVVDFCMRYGNPSTQSKACGTDGGTSSSPTPQRNIRFSREMTRLTYVRLTSFSASSFCRNAFKLTGPKSATQVSP